MSSKPIYTCETHKKKYVGYCESCNINICLLCTSKHEDHELLQYNEIQPSDKKVEELKQQFIEYKKQNKILKEKLQLWLEKVNYYTNKIQEILENNEKIYENILSNYDTSNLIYSDIDNINEVRKKGLILGYKNIDLNCFSTDDKILEKSDIIMKAIKELQIEDIFFSLKEQKNILGNINVLKNNKKEKDKKQNEDKKGKKIVKKKKSDITNKVSKKEKEENDNKKKNETDKELAKKKYEDFKEINLKSKLFDTDFLINLDKPKSNNLNNDNSSSLFRTVNNIREINHLSLITYNNKKYIITTGYCYINLFDLKGELQRSIRIHDNDITYIIQLQNGDLLTCCVDGTMKIIRLGKNEGFTVIQNIDTTTIKSENKNGIFSNNQLYVLLQIKSNQNIITVHGNNLLFYTQTKENKDIYEFNQTLATNQKGTDNDYDIIFNNNSISSLIEIDNDNFVGLNNNAILFFELDKEKNKYIFKSEIKDICGNGGPNNIVYFNNKIMIGGGENIFIVDEIEKKLLNQIKINCCTINCININKNSDILFIGYENKQNEYEISENKIISKEKIIEIEEKKIIKNAHTGSISNVIPLEEIENKEENMNVKVNLVSGAHDKNLKYWA